MKKAKLFSLGAATLALGLGLTACGSNNDKTADSGAATGGDVDKAHTVAMVTDIGGVDDRSFNQSAWEGLQAWGKEHGAEKGVNGFDYIQSNDGSEYTTNIDSAVSQGFKTIFGIGYLLQPGIEAAAAQNPDTQFGIIDSVIEGFDNVVSATFKDNEAAYLAGIAAAYTTKTDKVGFIGGEEGVVIDRFEAGFAKGVEDGAKNLGKKIEVTAKYAASFGDPAKGKALAADMYKNGADIIYHASGGTGAGLFQEAAALNKDRASDDKVWVIGVDSDQQAEGVYKNKDGEEDNFTLTSTLKGVGAAVQDISTRALNDEFPGGESLVYGLKDGGVDLTDGFLSDDAKAAVKEAKQNVIDGKVEVPETPGK
ncbi:BMP family lipoprotein [Vagococcus xieshaowenii]|uniref:BMP family ABC transporter substrate-binding protein n=1 Tax=Vagococcus xieshaowenii TaxID=2562451 RepID=A0AAJ5EF54_9ENTE|nr:BMP family protein [Vagococcus xieshaowenii]QCA29539.1 BMP family ABC transporter substrate-binding protein [Vagococcus xieshaowenii]TFZ42655.1 BMP family ABC transporter substrate-binding protein [Vagococcus xieshaowenii]